MRLTRVSYTTFRNLRSAVLPLGPGLTLLHGPNGQGKTNLLEGIYLLATGRSHRGARDAEIVQAGADGYRVAADLERPSGPWPLEVRYRVGGRRVRLSGGRPLTRAGDLPRLVAVLFSPDDLALVKGGPAERRRFLDADVAHLFPRLQDALARYERVVLQRNAALQAEGGGEGAAVWDEQLVQLGVPIVRWRQATVARLERYVQEAMARLGPAEAEVRLVYRPALEDEPPDAEGFRRALAKVRGKERARGRTLVGPHRDDVQVVLGGRDARAFASQGEQRSLAVALKVAALRLAEETLGDRPVLLLDDVLSELDPVRRERLTALLPGGQTVITATSPRDLPSALAPEQYIAVQAGTVHPGEREGSV